MAKKSVLIVLAVFMILVSVGTAQWSQEVIDLTTDPVDIYIHDSMTSIRPQIGRALAVGDFDKDGLTDMAIGVPLQYSSEAGKVYLFYGRDPWPADIDLATTTADLEITGVNYDSWLGWALAFSDLDGDGYDDLAMGAPGWYGSSTVGSVHIIFGRATRLTGILAANGSESLTISGKYKLGFALACGDVDSNGFRNLVVSAPGAAGYETYVLDGSRLAAVPIPGLIDLSTEPADVTIKNYSPAYYPANGGASIELACGDINGDEIPDILLGAPMADPVARSQAGMVYVFYGKKSWPPVIDVSANPADVTIYGSDPVDRFGNALAMGDINHDGYSDLIAGEYQQNVDSGGVPHQKVRVFFGAVSWDSVIDLASEPADLTVLGDGTVYMFGLCLAAGDLDGDAYDDLVIGAPYHRGRAVYAIRGRDFLPPLTIDLKTTSADLTVLAGTDNTIHWLGYGVACGDVNNDSADDLIMGAEESYPSGKVFVVFGKIANRPPAAADQSVGTDENVPVNITLVATDDDGDPLAYSIVDPPVHGTLSGDPPNVTYTPLDFYYGPDVFTFQAYDGKALSNVATVSITVRRVFAFTGFFPPVDNLPLVNSAKAGSAVPVKWRVTDLDGTPISDPAMFTNLSSYPVSCIGFAGDPVDEVETYAGGSGLKYLGDGYWQFNWKTPKSYAGQCRVMALTLADVSVHSANFKFK